MIAAATPVRFTANDAQRAFEEWGANCGPGAVAAICGLTLDELRPHMGDFERKRYTNPTLMWSVLRNLGVRWKEVAPAGRFEWPQWGLARVQWEGPWTKPGVPMAARYRHTHWVGAHTDPAVTPGSPIVSIFDINCICVGGWVSFDEWSGEVVPWLLGQCEPKADGRWHLTHAIEIHRSRSGG